MRRTDHVDSHRQRRRSTERPRSWPRTSHR